MSQSGHARIVREMNASLDRVSQLVGELRASHDRLLAAVKLLTNAIATDDPMDIGVAVDTASDAIRRAEGV